MVSASSSRQPGTVHRTGTGFVKDKFPLCPLCVVFRCVAQSAFILLVCHCLSHTTRGSFCNISKTKNGQHLLDYRCCPLKICFDPFSDRMKESNFLILFVGCALLRLFKILAGRVHIGFHFPKLLRIPPDGFELSIGFGMLLCQAGIRIFRNEKSCTRRFMIFILRQHRTMGAAGFGGSFAPNRAA